MAEEAKRVLMQCPMCRHIYGRGTNNPVPTDKKCKLCVGNPKLVIASIGKED